MGNVASLEKMWEVRKQNHQTDFRLMIDGKSIAVHKNVLAHESTFFAQLFEDDPELQEYPMKANIEIVLWLAVNCYWGPRKGVDITSILCRQLFVSSNA
ncbi:hypothetical protein M3Y94_00002000 [Aphelenchoides besseyi]|nr:hypothetical protein M3Y94_00002000 [Aphelenchoides besseyi]